MGFRACTNIGCDPKQSSLYTRLSNHEHCLGPQLGCWISSAVRWKERRTPLLPAQESSHWSAVLLRCSLHRCCKHYFLGKWSRPFFLFKKSFEICLVSRTLDAEPQWCRWATTFHICRNVLQQYLKLCLSWCWTGTINKQELDENPWHIELDLEIHTDPLSDNEALHFSGWHSSIFCLVQNRWHCCSFKKKPLALLSFLLRRP